MVYDYPSPSARSSFDGGDSNARKRVCKACDRCRLKKSKCDGNSPCSRCRADNAICQFGERKRSLDKVYPKGYVEMLEQHFTQLVGGLRELYRLAQESHSWPGEPLPLQRDGHPLTHDILQRLNVLRASPDNSVPFEGFEESPERLLEAAQRQLQSSSSSGHSSRSPSSEEEPATPLRGQPLLRDPFSKPTPPPNMASQAAANGVKRSSIIAPHQRPRFPPGSFSTSNQVTQAQAVAAKRASMPVQEPIIMMNTVPMDYDMAVPEQPTRFPDYSNNSNNHMHMSQQMAFSAMPTFDATSMMSSSWPMRTPGGEVNWDSWLQTQ